jgi:hypothetical protein
MTRKPHTVKDGPLEGSVFAVESRHEEKSSLRLGDGRVAVYRARGTNYPDPGLKFVGYDPFA